jgi:hypothetical protein
VFEAVRVAAKLAATVAQDVFAPSVVRNFPVEGQVDLADLLEGLGGAAFLQGAQEAAPNTSSSESPSVWRHAQMLLR